MSASLTNNKILVTDADGQVKFDTDHHMFFTKVEDFHAGSINIPIRGIDSLEARDIVHPIADVSPIANRVLGVFRVRVATSVGPIETPGFGWYAAGGTYFHNGGGNLRYETHPYYSADRFFETCSLYTFRIVDSKLELFEQVQISGITTNGQQIFLQSPFVIDYRLWCGRFDV